MVEEVPGWLRSERSGPRWLRSERSERLETTRRCKRHRCAVVTRFSRGTVSRGHTCAVVAERRARQIRSIATSPEVVTDDRFSGTGTAVIDYFVVERTRLATSIDATPHPRQFPMRTGQDRPETLSVDDRF